MGLFIYHHGAHTELPREELEAVIAYLKSFCPPQKL